VSVLTRRPEHAALLREHGLLVSGKHERQIELFATNDPAELPQFDIGIIACKALHLELIASRLHGHAPGAAMMTVHNGLGAEAIVAGHGGWPIISAVTFMSGTRHSDVHFEYELDTPTWMGPWAQTASSYPLGEALAQLMIESGLEAEAMPDLLPAQWSKLIFNSAINSVAAPTDLPHVALFAQEERFSDLGRLVHGLIDEGVAVAAAAGVALRDDPWEMNVLAVARGETGHSEYAHRPSMLEDVLAHQRTEVDFIKGALVREAECVGVAVPLNTAMYRLVRGREASWDLDAAAVS
jgi:2-dehydropantoate 2-reductase